MKHPTRRCIVAAGLLASAALATPSLAQSSNALLDKLVQKGVLTRQEADALRKETEPDFKADVRKSVGFPEWVTGWKIGGDFRGRFEQHNPDSPLASDRNRYRYRLRLGTTVTLVDDFEVGLRLASANPAPGGIGFGGNPVSANTDLSDGASRKFIFLDAAYVKWTPIRDGAWTLSGTFGKFDQPFALSTMVFDPDYQPEGFAAQAAWTPSADHTLKFNAGMFVLDEIAQAASASHDPFLLGAQLLWEARWSPRWETALGLSSFSIAGRETLLNASAPNVNAGNTRTAAGAPMFAFNPLIVNASVTCRLDSFPLYKGAFPVKLGGEWMRNPAAPANNEGWWAGLTLGKAGHRGLWELSCKYQRLEADAWFEELPDDDFGGFYAGAPANSGLGAANYFGGTNVRGHVLKGTYSFNDSMNLSVTAYLTDLIAPTTSLVNGSSQSGAYHLLVDLMWRF